MKHIVQDSTKDAVDLSKQRCMSNGKGITYLDTIYERLRESKIDNNN